MYVKMMPVFADDALRHIYILIQEFNSHVWMRNPSNMAYLGDGLIRVRFVAHAEEAVKVL